MPPGSDSPSDPTQPLPADGNTTSEQLTSLGRAINTQNPMGPQSSRMPDPFSQPDSGQATALAGDDEPSRPVATTSSVAEPPKAGTGHANNIYTELCTQIVKEQQRIIGDLAVEQASLVVGLIVDPDDLSCTVSGDGSKVINDLIEQYRDFFGYAAVEVCKEAASRLLSKLPDEQKPSLLR